MPRPFAERITRDIERVFGVAERGNLGTGIL
jgi:hypothetical protein